jgi:hypothetical protein
MSDRASPSYLQPLPNVMTRWAVCSPAQQAHTTAATTHNTS